MQLGSEEDGLLADEVAKYYADPLGFVLAMYPWGEPGLGLEDQTGPDEWQAEFLRDIGREVSANGFAGTAPVRPLRRAVSSGHGIGKSTIVAWLVDWIMSTRPHSRGTITANTFTQLEDKTWASIKRWTALCLTNHWFSVGAHRMYRLGASPSGVPFRDSWYCSAQSCKRENSEAFAGQHSDVGSSFYMFDEDSNIDDEIHVVAEGGLTDGEPMIFLFGNPTRNTGAFYRACFGDGRTLWNPTVVDSRNSRFTNKELIAEWVKLNGEDSDFVRVRVRGLPPAASDLQFISSSDVYAAQKRELHLMGDEPLLAGVDLARAGSDETVVRFRRGMDARSIPAIRLSGDDSRDSMRVATVLADVLAREFDGRRVHTLFLDTTGGSIGGPIGDRLRQLGHRNVFDVGFGNKSPDSTLANMRTYMWSKLRDWLRAGGCIDSSPSLETDLTGPGYLHDQHDRVGLESKADMKARGLDSPDDGDSLATTFAAPVSAIRKPSLSRSTSADWAWT